MEVLANVTDMSNINQLEVPQMDECNLAEVKKSLGENRLMGNLHTHGYVGWSS